MAANPTLVRLASGHPSTTILRGGAYTDPRQRVFGVSVDVEYFNLPSLPERMSEHLLEALVWHVRDVAEAVVDTAQAQLRPGHGYRTGLLKETLVARLAQHLLESGVYYDLLSEEAYYWRWVEFGHWMVNGEFWEGYHFLESSVLAHEADLRRACREAYADAAVKLAAEAKAPLPTLGGLGPL